MIIPSQLIDQFGHVIASASCQQPVYWPGSRWVGLEVQSTEVTFRKSWLRGWQCKSGKYRVQAHEIMGEAI